MIRCIAVDSTNVHEVLEYCKITIDKTYGYVTLHVINTVSRCYFEVIQENYTSLYIRWSSSESIFLVT